MREKGGGLRVGKGGMVKGWKMGWVKCGGKGRKKGWIKGGGRVRVGKKWVGEGEIVKGGTMVEGLRVGSKSGERDKG